MKSEPIKGGSKRMRERGHVRIEVWADEMTVALFKHCAVQVGLPLATFVRRAAQCVCMDEPVDEYSLRVEPFDYCEYHEWRSTGKLKRRRTDWKRK